MKYQYITPTFDIEEFREHPNIPGIWVGNLGTIMSTHKSHGHLPMDPYGAYMHPFKTNLNSCGYLQAGNLGLVHRLVAETWIPNPYCLPCINHIDEDKLNNCVGNLEWCDRSYNVNYGSRNAKVASALKGTKRSAETKAKMSASHRGKRQSPDTRAKISASMKGNHNSKK